ncbi:MAG: hypothetical protein U1F25_14025 [Rubrivivax sp.]
MVPRKGVDNVIRALALMSSAKRAVRLVVVGGNSAAPDEAATPGAGPPARGGAGVRRRSARHLHRPARAPRA